MPKQKNNIRKKQSWDCVSWLLLFLILSSVFMIGWTAILVNNEFEVPEVVEVFLPEYRHPLTGELLEEELEELPQVFSVMVENAADAWPLSGIDQAFLVIEAPVEAGIPRFITFFEEEALSTSESQPGLEKLGPIRSARPYYLDWALWMDAVYAHVGGSPEALDLIGELDVIDVNQFFESEYFYRQTWSGRYAPHNVFTDGELLQGILDEFELDEPDYGFWSFADGESQGASSAAVDFADGLIYDVRWEYDVERNQYQRYQGSYPMLMEDGAEIWVDNVVVMATDIRTIDAVGRKELRTIGEGDVYILQNGEGFLGAWEKNGHDDQLRILTTNGYEVTMNAGKTWIQVVDGIDQVELFESNK